VPVSESVRAAAALVPKSLMAQAKERTLASTSGASKGGRSARQVPPELAWMEKLAGFDYWPSEGPSPPWFLWAMIRWSSGELRAFQQSRDLARLAGTTEHWADAMDMMLVLQGERDEYDKLTSEKRAPIGFAPFTRETLERASRVIGVTADFFDFRWPAETLAAVYGDPVHRVGLCAGIEQGLDLQLHLRPFLESSYADRFRVLDRVLEQTKPFCRLEEQRKAWANRGQFPESLLRAERSVTRVGGKTPPAFPLETFAQWRRYARVPFLNRYLGLRLAEMASADPELGREY
jgi:hypothetical protein